MHLNDLLPDDKLGSLPLSNWRRSMFFGKVEKVEDIRGCVGRLLEFAESQGILDAEMLTRLGSEDYAQFRSAIHEIAIGEFLSTAGRIDWHPPGRDSRIGEFNFLHRGYEPIFVEVKTIFGSSEERRRDNNGDTLREVSHKVCSPFRLIAEITRLECDIVPRHFRAWLQRQVASLKKELTQLDQRREITFKDQSELGGVIEVEVEFVKSQDDGLPTSCDLSYGDFSNLRERVIDVINGSLNQLPDNQPTLVVLASVGWLGLGEDEILTAMFSYPKITYRLYTEPAGDKELDHSTIHYDLQGIVQKSVRKRLSGVGLWHQKWTKEPSGTLNILHNPLATEQIPYHILDIPNVCQLVQREMDSMEWMPNRPSK